MRRSRGRAPGDSYEKFTSDKVKEGGGEGWATTLNQLADSQITREMRD